MTVVTVKVTLAGDPLGVTDDWENLHSDCLGKLPQLSVTAWSNPWDGVTRTVYSADWPAVIVCSAGETESEKSANRRVSGSVVACEPLVPLTVKLRGFVVEAVRPLRVNVLVCPEKIVAGSKAQVTPAEQDNVMLALKSLGADAETLNVAELFPTITVVVGLADVREKTATPVPDRVTP